MRAYWYTAGELFDRQKAHPGEQTFDSLNAMALAADQKKASDSVSNSMNMIHARELDINAITTVSDLFELIDLPYRVTKHAQLSIVPKHYPETFSLRLEWRGEPE